MIEPLTITTEQLLHRNAEQIDREKQLIDKAIQLINDSKNDPLTLSEAIKNIVLMLVTFDSVKQDILSNYIAEETGINVKLLKSELRKENGRKVADDKVNGDFTESVPTVTMVEMFIEKHYRIRYNDISNTFEVLDLDSTEDEPEWENMNENTIYRRLQKQHIKYSISDLTSLLRSDFVEHYNPIRNYFTDNPEWDGLDHIAKLATYVIVQPTDRARFNRMFRKMLIRSVACSLEYTFNKHAFILVHEKQNSGKSTFLRWLCPPTLQSYYTENINTDKDSLIALTENFIINLDELSTLSKFEINALKSVMSKDKIKVRIPYDRRPSLIQRRCNFVGSTNRVEFLNDETGNVRWICFQIEELNWNYMQECNIDQVWAQAYYLFTHTKNKYEYQLTVSEIEENEEANRQFLVRTTEMEMIQRFYLPGTPDDYEMFMSSSDMMEALQIKAGATVKLTNVQVGKALAMLGFKRDQKFDKKAGFMIKGYFVKNNYEDYTKDKFYFEREKTGNNQMPEDVKNERSESDNQGDNLPF